MAKLQAYALQDTGLDTIAANHVLGFEADCRDFSLPVAILNDLGSSAFGFSRIIPINCARWYTEALMLLSKSRARSGLILMHCCTCESRKKEWVTRSHWCEPAGLCLANRPNT
jgi:hypothetical protein